MTLLTKNIRSRKGFLFIDALMASIVLTLIGAAVAVGCVAYSSVSSQVSHRLEAIDICRSVVEQVRDKGDSVVLGTFDEGSDPEVCRLPDSYFAGKLHGRAAYEIKDKPVEGSTVMRMAEVTVTWKETAKKSSEKKESIAAGLYFYDQSSF